MNTHLSEAKREPGNLQIGIILVSVCLTVLVTAILGPSLPKMQLHFADVENVASLVPLTLTIPLLVMSVFCVIAGIVSDKVGRIRLLVVAAFAYGIVGTAPLYLQNLHYILASRLLLGVAEAFVMVIGVSLVGDFFSGEKRERVLAMQAIAASTSAFVFNNLGGVLGEAGWRIPYWIYAVGFPLSIMAALFLWEPAKTLASTDTESVQESERSGSTPEIILMCVLSVFFGLIFLTVPVNFAYLFFDIGVESAAKIGMAYGLNSLGVIVGGVTYGWFLSGRLHFNLLIALSSTLMALGFLGMWQADNYSTLAVSGVISGLGSGIVLPSLISWCMKLFPGHRRGVGMGLFQSFNFFGNFLAGIVIVLVASLLGGRATAMMSLGVALFMIALIFLLVVGFSNKQRATD